MKALDRMLAYVRCGSVDRHGVSECNATHPRNVISSPSAAIVLLAAGGAAACSPAQNGGVENANPPAAVVSADSRVMMERLPCYGTCPVYRVEITADGTVSFTGERFVDSIGRMSHRIEPLAAAALMQELAARGFFELANDYTYGAKECGSYHTDAPGVNLTVGMDGQVKTVRHDYGCGGAPDVLRELQERVDSVAGVARWVGR